jgi:hypothetical protein
VTWIFIFYKRREKIEDLKPIYFSYYLTKTNQKIKQFEGAIMKNKLIE